VWRAMKQLNWFAFAVAGIFIALVWIPYLMLKA
jgi:hypothetical protein